MKQDLRVTVTKRMIQEALIRLLGNKPIDKIKVNELCNESGVNRATFYRHYESLQDILREIETDVIRAMPQPRQKPRNLEDARAYLEQVCSYIYDHIEIMQILLTNRTDDEMMQSMAVFYRDYLDIYLKTLPIDKPSEDTVQIAITLFAGGCHCLMKKCVMGQIRKTPAELADILCSMARLQESFPLFYGNNQQ